MHDPGELTKRQRAARLIPLALLAVAAITMTVFALATEGAHDGSAPGLWTKFAALVTGS